MSTPWRFAPERPRRRRQPRRGPRQIRPRAAPAPAVRIRQARPGDRPALAAMLARCSDQTRLSRLHGNVRQRRGISARLLGMLIEHADRSRLATLIATVLAEQAWIPRALRSYGTCQATLRYGVFEVTLRRGKEQPSGR